jgi:hypothetical protein
MHGSTFLESQTGVAQSSHSMAGGAETHTRESCRVRLSTHSCSTGWTYAPTTATARAGRNNFLGIFADLAGLSRHVVECQGLVGNNDQPQGCGSPSQNSAKHQILHPFLGRSTGGWCLLEGTRKWGKKVAGLVDSYPLDRAVPCFHEPRIEL